MPVSDKARQAVMERANGHCQFWHSEPFPADQISHKDHQGHGGLPATHWKNLPPNLAASCGECHARFHQGRVYMWEEFDAPNIEAMNVGGPVCAEVTMLITETNNMDDAYRVMKNAAIEANMGRMVIRAPNGQFVPESDLWFYQRWEWFWAEDMSECLKNMIQQERLAAWKVAEYLAWFKEKGVAPAIGSVDVLDLGASLGLSSAEVKKRIRVNKFRNGGDRTSIADMSAIDLDVADRLRKIPEKDLVEVAGWFADLPPAEAWARFNERYPGPERQKKYRIFTGSYREVTATKDEEVEIQGGAIVVKGGSVIAGVRKEVE